MDTKGKYVIGNVQCDYGTFEVAICFPEIVTHKHICECVIIPDTQKAAGFFTIDDGIVTVYGESTSTGLKSRKGTDERLIKLAVGL